MPLRAAAQASVCMEGCSHLPQSIVAPCRADEGDAKGQDWRRVACLGEVLCALRHLTCTTSLARDVKAQAVPSMNFG